MSGRHLAAGAPASGAVVMGTAVVSVDLSLDGQETLSRIVLVIAAAAWVALGSLLIARTAFDRASVRRDAGSPAALTGVAGTAVLGSRLAQLGWRWAGPVLLGLAAVGWLALLAPVLRHWVTPALGVSFMLTVATEAPAALAATLATGEHARWLVYAAMGMFLLGLAFYAFVLAGFDLRQIGAGRGDHWVSGGALAISALAAGEIVLAAGREGIIAGRAIELVALAAWVAAMLWLPVLLGAELVRPRWGYDVRRWSTVFPVGMYAACSFTVGAAAHAGAVRDFAAAWTWVACAVWLVTGGAMVWAAVRR